MGFPKDRLQITEIKYVKVQYPDSMLTFKPLIACMEKLRICYTFYYNCLILKFKQL